MDHHHTLPSPPKTSLINGRLIDPKNRIDALLDIHLADGRIAAIGQAPDGFSDAEILNAHGHTICPGLVDLSARLPHLDNELAAAVAGGITQLACPPDTQPPLDEPGLVERLVQRANSIGLAKVHPLGALTRGLRGENLAELHRLASAGCIAFSHGNIPLDNPHVLLQALQYAHTFAYPVFLQAQDARLSQSGIAHEGAVATRLGLPGIPVVAETVAIASAIELVRYTGARLHFTRLSSAAGVQLLRQARQQNLPISCDIAVHHLHLSESDIGYFNSAARISPPLRSSEDREALASAAAEGLAAICSDHNPINTDGKQLPFSEAQAGVSSLELLLPLTLHWAKARHLPLCDALARITCDPAAILNSPAGHLSPGAPADLCLFDPEAPWAVNSANLISQGKNTPFMGHTLQGKVLRTIIAGRTVFTA